MSSNGRYSGPDAERLIEITEELKKTRRRIDRLAKAWDDALEEQQILERERARIYMNARRHPRGQKPKRLSDGKAKIRTADLSPYITEALALGTTYHAIAQKAFVHEATVKNIHEMKHEYVQDFTADAIFSALGLPHVYAQLTRDERLEGLTGY